MGREGRARQAKGTTDDKRLEHWKGLRKGNGAPVGN